MYNLRIHEMQEVLIPCLSFATLKSMNENLVVFHINTNDSVCFLSDNKYFEKEQEPGFKGL